MVHDYWLWRDDAEFVKRQMPAVRSVAEAFRMLIRPDGLMDAPNGWNFMDWVDKPKWDAGVPAEGDFRPSSIINLQFALVLTHKAAMEEWAGEKALAGRDRDLAKAIVKAVLAHYWDAKRGLIADDSGHTLFSEHAQCLAILTGLAACFAADPHCRRSHYAGRPRADDHLLHPLPLRNVLPPRPRRQVYRADGPMVWLAGARLQDDA